MGRCRELQLALGSFVLLLISDAICREEIKESDILWGIGIIAPFVAWCACRTFVIAYRKRLLPTDLLGQPTTDNHWIVTAFNSDVAFSVVFATLVSGGSLYSRILNETWVHPVVLAAFLCMYSTADRCVLTNWCLIASTTVSFSLLAHTAGVARLVLVFSVIHLVPPQGKTVFSVFYRRKDARTKDQSYFQFEERATIVLCSLYVGIFLCLGAETIIGRLTKNLDWDDNALRTLTLTGLALFFGVAQIVLLFRSQNSHLISPALTTTASCVALAYGDHHIYVIALYAAHASECFDLVALALWDLLFLVLVN